MESKRKVISFKVNSEVYYALRQKTDNFGALFEPIAIDLSSNNRRPVKYTDGIHKNFGDLYIYISQIQEITEKISKLYDFQKNENKNNDGKVKQ